MNYIRPQHARARSYSHLRADRIGQSSLVDLAQRLAAATKTRCLNQCSLREKPVSTEPTLVVLGPGTELSVVGVQPGWVRVVATLPGAGGVGTQTFTGWVAVQDLDPATPAGRLPPEPAAPPIPEETEPLPSPGGGMPAPTIPGGMTASESWVGPAVRTLGEMIVLTSPAWAPMLFTHWARR